MTLRKIERGEMGNISVKTLDIILSTLNKEIEFKVIGNFCLSTLDELQRL